MRRTYAALHHVTGLQTVVLDLLCRYVNVVRRREIVIVARTEEAITVWHYFQHAVGRNDVCEVELRNSRSCGLRLHHYGLVCWHRRRHVVKHVVRRYGSLIFYRQVHYGDEVCAVAWVAFPNSVCDGVTLVFRVFVVCVYLCLKLRKELLMLFVILCVCCVHVGFRDEVCWCFCGCCCLFFSLVCACAVHFVCNCCVFCCFRRVFFQPSRLLYCRKQFKFSFRLSSSMLRNCHQLFFKRKFVCVVGRVCVFLEQCGLGGVLFVSPVFL